MNYYQYLEKLKIRVQKAIKKLQGPLSNKLTTPWYTVTYIIFVSTLPLNVFYLVLIIENRHLHKVKEFQFFSEETTQTKIVKGKIF